MKMEPIVSSETSAIRTQTPGNYPKRNNLHLEHGESLRTKFSELLRYVNFGVVAACCVLCVSRAVFRMGLVMVVRLILCSVRQADITNNSLNVLNYNFNK